MPPISSTVKIVNSVDGTPIHAEATGNYQNPHVVLTAGMALSASIYDEFVQNERLLDSLYIVRAAPCPILHNSRHTVYTGSLRHSRAWSQWKTDGCCIV